MTCNIGLLGRGGVRCLSRGLLFRKIELSFPSLERDGWCPSRSSRCRSCRLICKPPLCDAGVVVELMAHTHGGFYYTKAVSTNAAVGVQTEPKVCSRLYQTRVYPHSLLATAYTRGHHT